MKRNTSKLAILLIAIFVLLLFPITHAYAAPGDLDLTFSGDGKLTDGLSRGDDAARGVAIQPDGKIVVVGSSWAGLSVDFSVARYNTDGSLDATFGIGGKVTTDFSSNSDQAYAIAIQQDGKIVLAGQSHFNFGLVRYNTDGSLDTTFGTGGKVTTAFNSCCGTALSVAIHTDGKIVAAGQVQSDFGLVRYNPDGSLDTSFDSDGKVTTDIFNLGNDAVYSVAIHSDGKIVAAGSGYNATSFRDLFALVQYNVDGSLDSSFDGDGKVTTQVGSGSSRAYSVAIQANGKIVAVGPATPGFGLVRYSSNGSPENVITVQIGSVGVSSFAIQPDGKIVAAGGSNDQFAVVRLNANFSVDTTFGTNGIVTTPIGSYSWARGIAIQTDGKIVAAGESIGIGNSGDFALVRYTANGSPDTSFDGDGKVVTDLGFFQGNVLYDTAIQADGKIVAAGEVRADFALLRYNRDGSPDTTFGSGTGKVQTDMGSTGDFARAVAIQPDGKIVVAGGSSDGDDNQCCFALARYNADGSLDNTFSGDGKVITGPLGTYAGAYDVVLQPDGKIVAAGYSGNRHFAVYRYNTDGSLDTSFGGDGMVTTLIGTNAFATAVGIQQDGKIFVAGSFFNGSNYVFTVARYDPKGSLDPTFDGDGIVTTQTSQQDNVCSAVIQPDGKIIVAGSRQTASNDYDPTGFALVRYNGDGSLDTTFGAGGVVTTQVSVHSRVHQVALQPDGKIVAAGSGGFGNTVVDFAVVRYHTDGSLDTTFGGDGITTADFEGSNDYAFGMALDNQGRAVVVGESEGRFALARFLLAPRRSIVDFDGDGRSDISVFRPSDSVWYLDRSTDGFSAVRFGLSNDKITPADYDGDGKTDISVFRDGIWYWIDSSNGSFRATHFGLASDVPVSADFTGDGRAELAIYRNGAWWTLDLSNNQTSTIQFGLPADKPVVADYDGDGRADQAIYRNGEWHLNRSSQGYTVVQFGLPADKPVVGDYDGDGKADQAVFREGAWYLNRSQAGLTEFQWGLATDIPAPADYDGDGKTDAAVYRDGTWYLLQTTSGSAVQQFGLANDRPVPAAFIF